MIPLIEEHRAALAKLCQEYGVVKLKIFGSAATGALQYATSDLDFIADFADKSEGYAGR